MAGRDERSADELDRELRAALETVKERREAEDRSATPREIAELERLVQAVHHADVNAWREQYRVGDQFWIMGPYNPPEFPREWWEGTKAELGTPPPGAEFRKLLAEPPPSGTRRLHPGGAPLEPVMRIENARQLQAVIDLALRNGNQLVIDQLARRFKVSRRRIRQAIRMRRRGDDLTVSPPELRTVTDSTGNVYWPTLEDPSKS